RHASGRPGLRDGLGRASLRSELGQGIKEERVIVRAIPPLALAIALTACGPREPAPAPKPAPVKTAPPEAMKVASPTLKAVLARGRLNCGVHQGLAGFAYPDQRGVWRGFDVDICRAIAAAVLGDANAVNFVPLA